MKKKWKLIGTGICVTLMLMAGSAFCNDMYVYPAKGQNQQQIDADKSDCYLWAKQQTGFDPATQAPPSKPRLSPGGAFKELHGVLCWELPLVPLPVMPVKGLPLALHPAD